MSHQALTHAISGAVGTAISSAAIYPLDLVNTRLKIQRQLGRDPETDGKRQYSSLLDALRTIYREEGGLPALYTGLGEDIVKSVADSFLFFLFYSWLRGKRLQSSGSHAKRPGPAEELAIGAAAGAAARLFTTPFANVVARQQTASLVSSNDSAKGDDAKKNLENVVEEIVEDKGVAGLWSGYEATLFLTLNPSITFFLDETLQHLTSTGNGPGITFLFAAVSKAVATVVTYPFQTAKARAQALPPADDGGNSDKRQAGGAAQSVRRALKGTVLGGIVDVARTEGFGALYDGLQGELLKAFFSHGITMLSKGAVHGLVVRVYFAIIGAWRRSRAKNSWLRWRLTALARQAEVHVRRVS
jgi:solute carrier family 25 (peroxisomal adenine nucleotide transporter), member 17